MTTTPSCPFTDGMLLADPVARLPYADWLEEQGETLRAARWRRLARLRLSPWSIDHLEEHLKNANEGLHRGHYRRKRLYCRLRLEDCLLAGLEAQLDEAPLGCFCVHGGGVSYGSGRMRYTTLCLAVRKADGRVAVDVGEARAHNRGGSPATVWPELIQFRPEWASCRARLMAWAKER